MAIKNVSPIRPSGRARDDEFGELLSRFHIAIAQLRIASLAFGDLSELSHKLAPAGVVIQEATNDLDQLYDDLDTWHVTHEHTAKEVRHG